MSSSPLLFAPPWVQEVVFQGYKLEFHSMFLPQFLTSNLPVLPNRSPSSFLEDHCVIVRIHVVEWLFTVLKPRGGIHPILDLRHYSNFSGSWTYINHCWKYHITWSIWVESWGKKKKPQIRVFLLQWKLQSQAQILNPPPLPLPNQFLWSDWAGNFVLQRTLFVFANGQNDVEVQDSLLAFHRDQDIVLLSLSRTSSPKGADFSSKQLTVLCCFLESVNIYLLLTPHLNWF